MTAPTVAEGMSVGWVRSPSPAPLTLERRYRRAGEAVIVAAAPFVSRFLSCQCTPSRLPLMTQTPPTPPHRFFLIWKSTGRPPLISRLYGGRLYPVETVSAAGSSPRLSPVVSHIAAVTQRFQSCILPTKGMKPNSLPGFISLEHPFATELEVSHLIAPCVISILWELWIFIFLWFYRPCPEIPQCCTLQ